MATILTPLGTLSPGTIVLGTDNVATVANVTGAFDYLGEGNAPNTLIPGNNIQFTRGAKSTTISASGITQTPNFISTATATAVIASPNIITYAGICTVSLPITAAAGSTIAIDGGMEPYIIAPLSGQQIVWGFYSGQIGPAGTLVTGGNRMTVTLICTVANTVFQVRSVTNGSAQLTT
jgi:hypothetical protein